MRPRAKTDSALSLLSLGEPQQVVSLGEQRLATLRPRSKTDSALAQLLVLLLLLLGELQRLSPLAVASQLLDASFDPLGADLTPLGGYATTDGA